MSIISHLYTAEVKRRIAMKNSQNEFHCLKCGHVIRTEMKIYNEKCPMCSYPVMVKANLKDNRK